MILTSVVEHSPVEEVIVVQHSTVVFQVAHEEVSPVEAVASEVVEVPSVAVAHHEDFKL